MARRRLLRTFLSCLFFLSILSISLGRVDPARADMAPPEFPPGSNLQPGVENTFVRMVSEVVTLSVMKESGQYRFSNSPEAAEVGQARVNAVFVMRNMGQSTEQMQARFPLTSLHGDGFMGHPEIFDLSAKINGSRVATGRINGPNPKPGQVPDVYAGPWATFPISFPVGTDVKVEINYTDYGATESPMTYFGYILETGAGWYGTIGSADIILRLPYPVNDMNTVIDQTTSGGTIAGNEMRWHYEDLEPTAESDMNFSLVLPAIWNQTIIETENVTRNPKDGEAWGRLGKAYKQSLIQHGRPRCFQGDMPPAYQKSFDAYAKAVELLPTDGLWHYGFADLLWTKIGFCALWGEAPLSESEKQIFGQELRLALSLEPKYEPLYYLDLEVKNGYPDFYNQYVLQLPTSTPNATLTQAANAMATLLAPTSTPMPTAAQIPTATITPLPTASPTAEDVVIAENTGVPTLALTPTVKPSATPSICGGALVIPFLMAALVLKRRTRN